MDVQDGEGGAQDRILVPPRSYPGRGLQAGTFSLSNNTCMLLEGFIRSGLDGVARYLSYQRSGPV
jgi:hypothetical protein